MVILKGAKTMNKHTAGPWRISGFSGTGFHIFNGPENTGRQVALVESTYQVKDAYNEGDANAHLIAAAPDMLEALKNILPHLDEYIKWHHEFNGGCSVEIEDGADIIRIAIAKAEGR
jgi:hypothetical protein